jgi:hypothetical protein
MSRPIVTAAAACILATLTACAAGPNTHKDKAINTALTGACLAADLPPCKIATPESARAQRQEAKAAATRVEAQQSANAATKDAVARSSCLTDTGPRLPTSPGQCAAYGAVDPSITAQH